ncbi:hypothetical protein VTN96DRAFT_8684 [Rasamsonia emersonii]|uniref:Peptidyl-tRNA hydrolase n=1 Tax=Rasamsonia emersonii (strain ATCC 16479 / CBS 393.64 / IMI 116815) TaxID=1408163 RepID=A0A0F4YJR8_RASE3|nr:Peptidyl-tRNA hydrolase [Rasamsonia emersonii CBS 393.64]KKA18537.1 Peptidyl-tRNA hydrolase [Rasamsonia emersonii CBS 393.64]
MAAATSTFKSPQRFLFIASIGNLPAPYTLTRHSAGHSLLTAVEPLLQERIGLVHAQIPSRPLFYQTWKCPSLMNTSGPPLTRRLKTWLTDQERIFRKVVLENTATGSETGPTLQLLKGAGDSSAGGGTTPVELNVRDLTHFRPTLVILHDELEASLGRVKVKRGGPEQASLRGHRGLISVMESLRGSGLLPVKQKAGTGTSTDGSNSKDAHPLSILRIGIGIGRPASRDPGAVADYVLTQMSANELSAVQAAAAPVVDILMEELYRKDEN